MNSNNYYRPFVVRLIHIKFITHRIIKYNLIFLFHIHPVTIIILFKDLKMILPPIQSTIQYYHFSDI